MDELSIKTIEKLSCSALAKDIDALSKTYNKNDNKYLKLKSFRNKLNKVSALLCRLVDYRTGNTSWLQFYEICLRSRKHSVSDYEAEPKCPDLLAPNLVIITKQLPSQLAAVLLVAWCLAEPCPVSPDFNFWKCVIQECNVIVNHSEQIDHYCKILTDLQSHHNEEDSQRAHHLFEMLKWSVVSLEIFDGAGILQSLKKKGRIYTNDRNIIVAVFRRIFWNHSKKYSLLYRRFNCIIRNYAVISYKATPSRGLGSNPSGNHVKSELWFGIFSTAFKLHHLKFSPTWELQHLIPGHAGQGSTRLDFASIIVNNNDLQFAFFIVEFVTSRFEIHKDEVVVVAELAYEFNRILSQMHHPTEMGISSMLIENEIISFNFQENNVEEKVENLALPELPKEAVQSQRFETKLLQSPRGYDIMQFKKGRKSIAFGKITNLILRCDEAGLLYH
ncbi:10053_t:CDS:2 [Funneliformis caledonium]|uniref:10053_t:CDS:1 n=1 Tax=Funneliformis caledonium TaxID=1117310 RepID=A0A9N8VI57_9GLOM|nr:10053_t:CDS:2 [Funneliformis caledonium]